MKKLLVIIAAALVLTGCKSSSGTTKQSSTASGNKPKTTVIENNQALTAARSTAAIRLKGKVVTASGKVHLTGFGGKDLSASAKLQMKRGEVVRLSLRVLGIEVAVLEFTPSGVLLVDRWNKQYVRGTYAQVDFLRRAGLDYNALEALFWNELFVPGVKTCDDTALGRFRLTSEQGMNVLSPDGTPLLRYNFYTDAATNIIHRLRVKSTNAADKGELAFNYDNFEAFGGRSFPRTINMASSFGGKNIGLNIALSSLSDKVTVETQTTVTQKYKQRSIADLEKMLSM